MKKVFLITLSLFFAWVTAASANPIGHGPDPNHKGKELRAHMFRVFKKHMIMPEMIMANQQRLGLSVDQKTSIKNSITEARSKMTGLEWDLHEAVQAMGTILEKETVDKQQAMSQLDKILDLENKIKKTRLSLVIDIKNELTSEQLDILKDLKEKMCKHHCKKGHDQKKHHGPGKN